jgi:hypothetical protein
MNTRYMKSYTGAFEENKFNGDGIIDYNVGSSFFGTFKEGKPDGTCTFENAAGTYYTYWQLGKFVRFISSNQRAL